MRIKTVNLAMLLLLLFSGIAGAQTVSCPSGPGVYWPVGQACETSPQPITGTLGELRRLSAESDDHLHDGVDIKSCPIGVKPCDNRQVFVIEPGLVGINGGSGDNQWIRIGRFAYVHLSAIDSNIIAFRQNGQVVPAGTFLGYFSPNWNHVHPKEGGPLPTPLSNPLEALINYQDTKPPTVPSDVTIRDWVNETILGKDASGRFILDPIKNPEAAVLLSPRMAKA